MTRRFEIKYDASHLNTNQIAGLIERHPCRFSLVRENNIINNIYFDTVNFNHISDNIEGLSDRIKIRFRWYGSQKPKIENATCEFKIKRAATGTKDRFRLPAFDYNYIYNEKRLKCLIKSIETARYSSQIAKVYPCIRNVYKRSEYIDWSKKIRLTMDTDISSFAIGSDLSVFNNPSQIIEVKFQSDLFPLPWNGEGAFNLRQTKSSKYVSGATAVLGLFNPE